MDLLLRCAMAERETNAALLSLAANLYVNIVSILTKGNCPGLRILVIVALTNADFDDLPSCPDGETLDGT